MNNIYGINLGSGNWNCPNWIGYDQLNGNYLNEKTIFPHNNETINYIYSSHFFEHINDDIIINLLKESHRVLKKGGILRLVIPHFTLLHQKYKDNDISYFFNDVGFKGRKEWKKYNVENSLENILAHWFSNYDEGDPDNNNGYRGPPRNLKKKDIYDKAHSLSTENFSKWLISNIPINDKNIKTQHINCPTMKKMKNILTNIGFINITKSSYMKSNIPDVIQTRRFDNEKNRSTFSLYIEANK